MSLSAQVTVRRDAGAIEASLDVADGETLALVGPNGAGKTTLVRALAGLTAIDEGRIVLDGRVLDDPVAGVYVPPAARRAGVVFQERVLFPHRSVARNVGFGLRAAGASRAAAAQAATDWLARVGCSSLSQRRPAELSGGQAALVALARALAPNPRLLLLDEPFAALDALAKPHVRRIVRRHLDAHTGPAILVTHDPVDAFSLASRIAVVEQGSLVQSGTPEQVRAAPASRFVAELVGLNWFLGTAEPGGVRVGSELISAVHTLTTGERAIAVVHPHAVAVHRERPAGSPRNVFAATVDEIVPLGATVRVRVSGLLPMVAELTPAGSDSLALRPGAAVFAAVKATEVTVHAV